MKSSKEIRKDSGTDAPSQLYLDAVKSRPSSADAKAKLASLTQKLESLAKKAGVSVSDLLKAAESSPLFQEDYLEALTTAKQIAKLKQLR